MLTYAGSTDNGRTYTVAGTVTSTIEDGGTCTFTLTGPGAPVTRTQAGLADATSTSCGSVAFPAAQLRPGTWKAQVSYSGPAGRGTSPTTDVEVR